MDYRKDMRTPKDRVDDELLARLLRETDELLDGCGCEGHSNSRRNNRSQRRSESSGGSNGSCGCAQNSGHTCKQHKGCAETRRDVNERGNGSGCGESRRDENERGNGCGCGESRRDGNERGNGCGCGESRRDGNERGNGCGCVEARIDGNCVDHGCIDRQSLSIQTQGLPLVMSYCPDHEFHELYEDEEALYEGTLFRELNFPFYGSKCGQKSDKKCGCGE